MAKEISMKEFLQRHNFVLCNNIANFELDWLFALEDDEYFEPYQYFLSSMSKYDVEYYARRYGLKFAWCELLGLYVFVNDIAYGMSFEDVVLEPIA